MRLFVYERITTNTLTFPCPIPVGHCPIPLEGVADPSYPPLAAARRAPRLKVPLALFTKALYSPC